MRFLESVPYLRVRDMARSLEFYRDGLGFSVTRQLDDAHGPFWARLEKDALALMISSRPSRFLPHRHDEHHPGHEDDEEAHFHDIGAAHDAELNFVTFLYVKDVDAAYGELKERGVRTVDAPANTQLGLRWFTLRDPDGYYYTLAQRLV
ncbi:MAG: hypothetical protein GEU75_03585 [Dehalococcoidia bacterium]|nr:hypothetical protein [Dehalococcoidia bacterium]